MSKMYVNGMGFRAIERICMSTSHQYYKLGKASRRIAQRCLRTRTFPLVGELDELETFVGQKK